MIRCLAACAALLGMGTGPSAQQKVSVREDGTILVKGEPFFPVGIVHVSSAGDDQKRSSDLQMIAMGGFNMMQAVVKPGDGAFLDEAEAFGIRVLGEAADTEALKAAVKDLKGKNAILGWNVAENADNGKRLTIELAGLRKEIKGLDPDRPTYATCGDIEQCGKFLDSADVIGLKSFPVHSGNLSGPANLFAAAAKASGETQRTFIAVIQAWAPKDKRAPTADEVRNMAYQALIQGARGVLFHAYLDKDWDMGAQTDLWNGVRVLAAEIQALKRVLLEGKLKRIDARTEDIFAGAWAHQGRITLAVVNTANEPKKVLLELPAEATGAGQPQFRVPARRLTLEGGKLAGEMGSGQAHVYVFETRNP